MKNKISIIIPAYNCEKYISRAIESVYKNKSDNFEVIVVNDGSNDNSINILNIMKTKYSNLKIIDKKNTGVSDSRNIGIENATGNWIMFCDSDDEYQENTIDEINKCINSSNDLSLVVFGRYDCNSGIINYCTDHKLIKKYNDRNLYARDRFAFGSVAYSVVNKVYCKKIIDKYNIRFDKELKYNEDLEFNINYLQYCNNIIEDFKVNYIRYCNDGSAMYSKISNYFYKNIKMISNIEKKYNVSYNNDFFHTVYMHYVYVSLNRLFTGIDLDKKNYFYFKKNVKYINNFCCDNKIKINFNSNFRDFVLFNLFKYKLYFILYLITIKIGNIIRSRRKQN